MRNWLLPEYIEDILPAEARRMELIRRQLLDLFHLHGFELVIPPLLEYVDSLLTGTGHDMDIRTFKVVDQLSGRLMGLRADITPQAARIDAHVLNRHGITRLCYAGTVLHTLPSGLMQTREPLQVGAELFGHAGPESDIEIQQLMVKALTLAGVNKIHLDVGHVDIFRSLVRQAQISAELESDLYQVLQTKDIPALQEMTAGLDKRTRAGLALLPELHGDVKILEKAQTSLPDLPEIKRALNELKLIAEQMKSQVEQVYFDLADLRGYHYHSGMVFAAYATGWANAIALGGRYDEVGKAFGRARPATGFSLDLRQLSSIQSLPPLPTAILAPHSADTKLQQKINELRAQGEVVIIDLAADAHTAELNCNRQLIEKNGVWQVVTLQ